MLFGADLSAMDQVGLAEHADEIALFVEDRKGADVVFGKELDCLGHIRIGADGHDIAHHDINRTHVAGLRIGARIARKGTPTASSRPVTSRSTPLRCCGSSTIAAPTHWPPWFRRHP